MPQSQLILFRGTQFRDTKDDYQVLINDTPVGTTSFQQHSTFDLPPGDHKLRLSIDWRGSKETLIHLEQGETLCFDVQHVIDDSYMKMIWVSLFAHDQLLRLIPIPKQSFENDQKATCGRCGDFAKLLHDTPMLCGQCLPHSRGTNREPTPLSRRLALLTLAALLLLSLFIGFAILAILLL